MPPANGKKKARRLRSAMSKQVLDVLSNKRVVYLEDLSKVEFDKLLQNILGRVILSELQRFKPLRDLNRLGLCFSFPFPRKFVLKKGLIIKNKGVFGFGLNTFILKASMAPFYSNLVYKNKRTNQKTNDPWVAMSWKKDCQKVQGSGMFLAFKQSEGNPVWGIDNLICIRFDYKKASNSDSCLIHEISVCPVRIGNFRRLFGRYYPDVAKSMLMSLCDAYETTRDDIYCHLAGVEERCDLFGLLEGRVLLREE